jgi:hypothetical protein
MKGVWLCAADAGRQYAPAAPGEPMGALNFTVRNPKVMATFDLASTPAAARLPELSSAFLLITVIVAMTTGTTAAVAANFRSVSYDSNSDQIIATMIYDGTNPDHHFSIQWGSCRKVDQPDHAVHQTIDVSILDDQWNDAAMKPYTKTVRVPLATLSCRPATVTLRTAPDFRASLDIPARP